MTPRYLPTLFCSVLFPTHSWVGRHFSVTCSRCPTWVSHYSRFSSPEAKDISGTCFSQLGYWLYFKVGFLPKKRPEARRGIPWVPLSLVLQGNLPRLRQKASWQEVLRIRVSLSVVPWILKRQTQSNPPLMSGPRSPERKRQIEITHNAGGRREHGVLHTVYISEVQALIIW